jgi:hypothetical protein
VTIVHCVSREFAEKQTSVWGGGEVEIIRMVQQ